MNGILNFSIHFNVVHRKVDWRNPKMKSLNSMPDIYSYNSIIYKMDSHCIACESIIGHVVKGPCDMCMPNIKSLPLILSEICPR